MSSSVQSIEKTLEKRLEAAFDNNHLKTERETVVFSSQVMTAEKFAKSCDSYSNYYVDTFYIPAQNIMMIAAKNLSDHHIVTQEVELGENLFSEVAAMLGSHRSDRNAIYHTGDINSYDLLVKSQKAGRAIIACNALSNRMPNKPGVYERLVQSANEFKGYARLTQFGMSSSRMRENFNI